MRRPCTLVLGALLTAAAMLPSGALAASALAAPARADQPRVVIVVGPVGNLTGEYRAFAESAATEALRWTPNVVRVYSPDATWPAVRDALRGASIVVYLGHGNGFPSPYGSTRRPSVQDGFGLNPVGGIDDAAHQYVGEALMASQVRLAPHAVVLLNHLCYASGNSEPGNPEPTTSVAVARADNYAAGFLAAGADAVIAESYGTVAPYVRALLGGDRSIGAIWQSAASRNGHLVSAASVRTPGATVAIDPDTPASGYHRSIVGRFAVRGSALLAAVAPGIGLLPPVPPGLTLIGSGVTPGAPVVQGSTVAGTTATLGLPIVVAPGRVRPANLGIGLRWDPVELAPTIDPPAGPHPTPALRSVAAARPSVAPPSSAAAAAAPESSTGPVASAGSGAGPSNPGSLDPKLVAPEVRGEVVTVARATNDADGISVSATMPVVPGLYRLVATIHDPGGVAYDAATQALIPALLVHVTGPTSAVVVTAPTIRAIGGATVVLPAEIVNTGTTTWAAEEPADPRRPNGPIEVQDPARLVLRWVALELEARTPDPFVAALPPTVEPGRRLDVSIALAAPLSAGAYLLVLDVTVPGIGSLAALGDRPTIVTVVVVDPPPVTTTSGR